MSKHGRLLGSLLLLGLLAFCTDWSRLGLAFARFDLGLCLLAAGVLVLAQGISSWRWRLLARVQHFEGSLGRFVAYYFIGMLFNQVLPTSVGGDVVRAWYLSAQEGTPPPPGRRLAAFLTVFAERFTGVLMLVALVCVSALCCPLALESWITASVVCIGTATLLGLAILLVLPRLEGGSAGGVLGRVRNNQTVRRLAEVSRLYLKHRGVLLAALGLSVVVQLGNLVLAWLLSRSLGLTIPFLYLGVLVPLVSLLTLLPITVNGMGLRAGATVVLLAPLGIGREQALSLSLLTFALVFVLSVIGGLGSYWFGRFPRFERTVPAETTGTTASDRGRKEWEGSGDEEPVRGDPDQGRTRQPPAAA